MEETTATLTAFAVGLAGGAVLGLAARLGRFCTLAAIEDALFAGNRLRLRMWVMAMAVGIFGVVAAELAGLIDPSQASAIVADFNPLSIIIGGLIFGIGMAFVGTCGFGTLVRLGGGDLKSFLVFLVLGVSALMAATGPTALLHANLIAPFAWTGSAFADPRIDAMLAEASGLPRVSIALAIGFALLVWTLIDPRFRASARNLGWGIVVGGVIAAGWLGTGWLAHDEFEPQPLVSFSFIYPLGSTLMYLMASTGSQLSFGIGSTLGVIAGAAVGATYKNEMRWQTHDDAYEARRQIFGAFLMGTGGMYALGCTFGQGLSAVSVLALSAPLALGSIWIGAWLGLNTLMDGSPFGFLGSLWSRRSSSGRAPAE